MGSFRNTLYLKTTIAHPTDGPLWRHQRHGPEKVWAGTRGWEASEFPVAGATGSDGTIRRESHEGDKDQRNSCGHQHSEGRAGGAMATEGQENREVGAMETEKPKVPGIERKVRGRGC